MSGTDAARPWPGQPAACTCTQMVVADLGDTLDCPAGWRAVAGAGWVHVLTGAEQAACEYAQTFAASLADTLNCPHPWQEQPDGLGPRPDRAGGIVNGPDYAARAAAGAEFLDGQVPGWARRIELATLNLHDGCRCVLGQLGGDYFRMRDDLHLSQDATVELGFALNTDDEDDRADWEDWAELDAAWAREIVTRREAAEAAS